jgi:hypothetical protein
MRHWLGHKPRNTLSRTTYQAPDRDTDLSAALYGGESDTTHIEFSRSVASGATTTRDVLTDEQKRTVKADETMNKLLQTFEELDLNLFEAHGKRLDELISDEANAPDDVPMNNAREAWTDVICRFLELTNWVWRTHIH